MGWWSLFDDRGSTCPARNCGRRRLESWAQATEDWDPWLWARRAVDGIAAARQSRHRAGHYRHNVHMRHDRPVWPSPGRRAPESSIKGDSPTRVPARRVAVVACIGYSLLVLAVHMSTMNGVDAGAREFFRPGDVWGPLQWRADVIVEGLRPGLVLIPFFVLAAAVCVARRSLRPVLLAILLYGLTAAITLGTKVLLARPDPGGLIRGYGGSFPSGHTATIIICSGVSVFLLAPGARWAWMWPAMLGSIMGAALLVQAAHWTTDIVGGALIAATVLAAAHAGRLDRWAAGGFSSDAHPRRANRSAVCGPP